MTHLAMLRDLQDETGGFLAYIPLAYHPDNNELGETLARTGTATTGFDDLKNLAVGRLFLDNFEHIKSHWIMVTPFVSQMSLRFGVNDLEGTVVREKIYHEAGAHTAQAMTLDQILRLIRGARRDARRARFVLQRAFARSTTRRPRTRGGVARCASAGFRTSTAIRSTARSIAASCRSPAELVDGVPDGAQSRRWPRARSTSASSRPWNTRATRRKYLLLPDLSICSDGPVRSVVLFSQAARVGAARAAACS